MEVDSRTERAMLKAYRGRVAAIAKRYRNFGVDVEDLVQEGLIGLVKAIRLYDPKHETGAPLWAFASVYVMGEMRRAVGIAWDAERGQATKLKVRKEIPSGDMCPDARDTRGQDMEFDKDAVRHSRRTVQVIEEKLAHRDTPESLYAAAEERARLKASIEKLPPKYKHLFQSASVDEASKKLKVSKTSIFNMKRDGIEQLRDLMVEDLDGAA